MFNKKSADKVIKMLIFYSFFHKRTSKTLSKELKTKAMFLSLSLFMYFNVFQHYINAQCMQCKKLLT